MFYLSIDGIHLEHAIIPALNSFIRFDPVVFVESGRIFQSESKKAPSLNSYYDIEQRIIRTYCLRCSSTSLGVHNVDIFLPDRLSPRLIRHASEPDVLPPNCLSEWGGVRNSTHSTARLNVKYFLRSGDSDVCL